MIKKFQRIIKKDTKERINRVLWNDNEDELIYEVEVFCMDIWY